MQKEIEKVESKKEKKQEEKEENNDVLYQTEQQDEQDRKSTPKKEQKEPQMISRPKGGDPKNMETLQELKRNRSSDDESPDRETKSKHPPKQRSSDEELNKKEEKDVKEKDVPLESSKKAIPADAVSEQSELQQEKSRIIKRIEELRSPTQEEYQDQILTYLECDNPKQYKKKSKGFSLPFNTRAKYEDTNEYKFKHKSNIEEIKDKVK